MTLTLDEVRRIRFPMARRPNEGYRAGEVDDFVDKVDATFTQMVDETDRLKKQLQSLRDTPSTLSASGPSEDEVRLRQENARLQAELDELRNRPQPVASSFSGSDQHAGEIAQLRHAQVELQTRNEQLSGQLAQAHAELDQARTDAAAARQRADLVEQQFASLPTQTAHDQGTGVVDRLVVSTGPDASNAVVKLVTLATEQAENLVAEAESEAQRRRRDAEVRANETTSAAEARAREIEGEARSTAERVTREAREQAESMTRQAQEQASTLTRTAQQTADQLSRDAQKSADQVEIDARNRRQELFAALESERDTFLAKVDDLKSFEANYRSSLISHLRGQVDSLESGTIQPSQVPVLLSERQSSATPRLDALLAERH